MEFHFPHQILGSEIAPNFASVFDNKNQGLLGHGMEGSCTQGVIFGLDSFADQLSSEAARARNVGRVCGAANL